MSEATIRTAIKDAIEGVANVGQVYDYQPLVTEWDKYLDFFKTGDSIRAWTIANPSTPQTSLTMGGAGSIRDRTYNYTVLGFFGVEDAGASEKDDRATVESVFNALSDALSDAGTGTDARIQDNQPSLTAWEPRMFGSVLCMVAEINLVITSQYTTS